MGDSTGLDQISPQPSQSVWAPHYPHASNREALSVPAQFQQAMNFISERTLTARVSSRKCFGCRDSRVLSSYPPLKCIHMTRGRVVSGVRRSGAAGHRIERRRSTGRTGWPRLVLPTAGRTVLQSPVPLRTAHRAILLHPELIRRTTNRGPREARLLAPWTTANAFPVTTY